MKFGHKRLIGEVFNGQQLIQEQFNFVPFAIVRTNL